MLSLNCNALWVGYNARRLQPFRKMPMPNPAIIHIVRHGEVHNPQGILYGRLPDFHLSVNGQAQADAAGVYLSQYALDALYVSPMQRAQETAQRIAQQQARPLPLITDERLMESHTPWEGKPHSELDAIHYEIYKGNQPPHELERDLRQRAVACVQDIRAHHAAQRVVCVTHGDILVTLFMYAVGQSAEDIGRHKLAGWGLPEAYPATASILTLMYVTADVHEIPQWEYVRPYALA